MKYTFTLLFSLVLALAALAQNDTNVVTAPVDLSTNAPVSGKSEPMSIEVTFGGGGISVGDTHEFALDFSFSLNPIAKLPNLWFGVNESVAFYPNFAGSTDLFSDWVTHIYKQLYVNTGWTVGTVYAKDEDFVYRTGPEVTFQFYVKDNAFIYAGANYDIVGKQNDNGFRYSFGIGLTF